MTDPRPQKRSFANQGVFQMKIWPAGKVCSALFCMKVCSE